FELKRLGCVTAMPLGVELGRARPSGDTALQRARAALQAHTGAGAEDGASPFDEPEPADSMPGLLVSRDDGVATPAAEHLPSLSALLRISRDVGAVVLGAAPPEGATATGWDTATRRSVADQLRVAVSRVRLPPLVADRVRAAERLLGFEIPIQEGDLDTHQIEEVLVVGARICFTGTAQDSAGRIVERQEMQDLARSAGLVPVTSVSKTRCDALVTAEAGTQSGKARKAREYGKPVFCADEFFSWLADRPAP
ncbi:MAG: AAA family ATPase, partial [Actinomycetota bacterium]|nr:AAA family ATPase [Actinomycetota bacterium]